MTWLLNFLRGGAVGACEALPGISGGTVALIVRLYDDLITGAGYVLTGIRKALTDGLRGRGLSGARAEFRQADWGVLIPALVGMASFLIVAIVVLEPIVHNHTQLVYAAFFGLVLGSLPIPYVESRAPWKLWNYALALAFAVLAFVLMGLPRVPLEISLITVFFSAAVAICALVIPGLSGSFILLTFGMYEPTLSAVRGLDFAYIATFMAGAIVGLASFVKLLQYLLKHRRHITLVILTGLMAGSLRALWPWGNQALDGGGTAIVGPIVAMVIGFAVITSLFWFERRRGLIPHTVQAS